LNEDCALAAARPSPLVSLICLAAFLTANGPLGVRLRAAARPVPAAEVGQPHAAGCHCCCCEADDPPPDEPASGLTMTSGTDGRPAPANPGCPCCPTGCGICGAVKVLTPAPSVVPGAVPCLDDVRLEAALLFPPPHPAELLQPPRA
jgi:hypothetical protein